MYVQAGAEKVARSSRFEMRVSDRWRSAVARAAEELGRSVSDFVTEASWDVAEGKVIPSRRMTEAIQFIEEVQADLRSTGRARDRRLVATLDDAVHCIAAAEDGHTPESAVWPGVK
jgi:uncharacterized protein (DUF1778 family)